MFNSIILTSVVKEGVSMPYEDSFVVFTKTLLLIFGKRVTKSVNFERKRSRLGKCVKKNFIYREIVHMKAVIYIFNSKLHIIIHIANKNS